MHSAMTSALHALPLASLAAGAVWAAAVHALLRWSRAHRSVEPSDAVIVPGCRVFDDGTPSPALRRRVAVAARAVLEGAAPLLVVSGHRGEADAAASLAIAHGLRDDQVIREPHARSTVENAALTAPLLPHARRVVIVSDDVHLLRCAILFRRHHREVRLLAARTPGLPWRYASRELGASARAWWLSRR